MYIIDSHTHCFPDALAERATERIAGIGGLILQSDGTANGMLAHMKQNGISGAVILNIATNERQMVKVNDFAIETNRHPHFCALGSVHPAVSAEVAEAELKCLSAAGVKGIKIHPDYMETDLLDPRFDPILACCEALDLIVITHAGWDFISPDHVHAPPHAIAEILRRYPRLRFVAAHMGGNRMWDDVETHLVGRPVWFDTSLTHPFCLPEDQMRRMLSRHDPERIVFGSDMPWYNAADEMDVLHKLRLPAETAERILSTNARRLFGFSN